MPDVAHMKWWGWGVPEHSFSATDKPKFAPFVYEAIGVEPLHLPKFACPLLDQPEFFIFGKAFRRVFKQGDRQLGKNIQRRQFPRLHGPRRQQETGRAQQHPESVFHFPLRHAFPPPSGGVRCNA